MTQGTWTPMAPFMSFPHTVPRWTKFVTADRVQTMQTGGLEPSPRDVSTYADTKISIKIRFDISLCLFCSLPKWDNILLSQGSSDGEQIKDSKKIQALWWWQPYKSQNRLYSLQKCPHTGLHTPARTQLQLQNCSHQGPAEGARCHLLLQHRPEHPALLLLHSTIPIFQLIAKLLGILKIKLCTHRGSKTLQLQCSYQRIYPYCKQDLTICLNSTDFRGHKGLLNFHYTSHSFYSSMDMSCLLMYSTDSFHSRVLLLTHKWKSR